MSLEKAILSWSGGKDSALAFYKVLQQKKYQLVSLVTNLNEVNQRVVMHGVSKELILCQLQQMDMQIEFLYFPESTNLSTYEKLVTENLLSWKEKGVQTVIFGDIFLADLKTYRENLCSKQGFKTFFPLWQIPSKTLITEFIEEGFKSVITCVNERYLDKSFVGRTIDKDFLLDLPKHVDPCGENGEYHSFVYDAPFFKNPIPIKLGEVVYKTYPLEQDSAETNLGFWFGDILLDS